MDLVAILMFFEKFPEFVQPVGCGFESLCVGPPAEAISAVLWLYAVLHAEFVGTHEKL